MKSLLPILMLALMLFSCGSKEHENHEESEHDLLTKMAQYQRFSQKIWFAAEQNNWELADFYTHELEEISEELIDNEMTYEGYNISALTKNMLSPAIEGVEAAIKTKNDVLMIEKYDILVQSCNACHLATDHSFVKIIRPSNPSIFNQDFSAN